MLMKLIVFLAVAVIGLHLLRGVWRSLVEIPDIRQVWVPDVVDDFLSRSISASLILICGLFLVLMGRSIA